MPTDFYISIILKIKMKNILDMIKYYIIISITFMVILCAKDSYSQNFILSDPDLTATGYEFNGTPAVKIGDFINFRNFYLGGFFEARNEKRFNQAVFPNHNWRGFAFLYSKFDLIQNENNHNYMHVGYEHESAHPTMGFYENNTKAYEMIYDNYYRNINLNSLVISYNHIIKTFLKIKFKFDYQYYFLGKNTPELHDDTLSYSQGLSGGMEFFSSIGGTEIYASIFDRYIFMGKKRINSEIYHDQPEGLVKYSEYYPIINSMNTLAVKVGVLLNDLIVSRKLNIYFKFLYGNIYGFVDSRENKSIFSIGIELMH